MIQQLPVHVVYNAVCYGRGYSNKVQVCRLIPALVAHALVMFQGKISTQARTVVHCLQLPVSALEKLSVSYYHAACNPRVPTQNKRHRHSRARLVCHGMEHEGDGVLCRAGVHYGRLWPPHRTHSSGIQHLWPSGELHRSRSVLWLAHPITPSLRGLNAFRHAFSN